ncbi:energy-coupling factor transporter transmembrane protein EcfT [Geobacter sp. DSM 9736]|uniref:energy-coupling factor transporter transmembrane component T family protein n=1 Tax=Geobacter sp. DSM 9736 TaxID=1277350 RepID=UPI000B50DDAE|nr:energy-coupling factor transporter transmembrane component T [Geobacter sp. DSM 9736]SNB44810.1 cobalt/nickel transport system permease protein [Geobacter sp. DSM 9736]
MQPLPTFLTKGATAAAPSSSSRTVRTQILEKGIHHLAELIRNSYIHWESSRRRGLLQPIDPRVKVLFLVLFLVVVSIKRTFMPQGAILLITLLLVAASRLDPFPFFRKAGWAALLFGVLIPLPSLLNLFGDGELLLPLIHLQHEHHFWQYRIPSTIGVTREGLQGMGLLTLRIGNSVALSMLVLHTTSFPELIKALRVLRVPESFVVVIILSYNYVLTFSRTVLDMHLAKKSRLLGRMDGRHSRRWAAGRIAALFHKSRLRCFEIYKAMISRGLENKRVLQPFPPLSSRDRLAFGISLLAAALILAA